MSWGRLGRLINRFPRTSWTARALGGEATRWGEQEHLLAALIDVTSHVAYLTRSAHFKGKTQPPEPVRRPGAPDPAGWRRLGGKRTYTVREIDEILAKMKPKAVTDGS